VVLGLPFLSAAASGTKNGRHQHAPQHLCAPCSLPPPSGAAVIAKLDMA
jgi:hypothetical protein